MMMPVSETELNMEGSVSKVFRIMKDTVDTCGPSEDKKRLLSAVSMGDMLLLEDLKSTRKFTSKEIVQVAIDQDEETVVDRFKADFERKDTLELLDETIKKKAVKSSRRLSMSMNLSREQWSQLLRNAVEKRNLDYVHELLDLAETEQAGPPLHKLLETPLHMAARTTCAIMTRSLSKRNLNWMHQTLADGSTPLHLAAEQGCVEVVTELLELGAKVDVKDNKGRTPLILCVGEEEGCKPGAVECMEILFKFKAQVDEKGKDGLTALHLAARGGKKAEVIKLIEKNAHLNQRTPQGVTALELIAQKVPSAIEQVKAILNSGIWREDPDNETKIRLDFRKFFSVPEGKTMERGKTETIESTMNMGNMGMFLTLAESPFKSILEHPLLRAFLYLKMKQVRYFYSLLIASHLIFSVVFSVYCGLLFSQMCPPNKRSERKDLSAEIVCDMTEHVKKWDDNPENNTNAQDNINAINISRVFLFVFIPILVIREAVKISNVWLHLKKFETWRNTTMIVLMIALIFPFPSNSTTFIYAKREYIIVRWQYYLAAVSCFLLWIEMLVMIGRLPLFGKYIQMYKSVAFEMFKFCVAYAPLLIGFMMLFMILFSEHSFFTGSFTGMIGKVMVMMTGEFEYEGLMYPTKQEFKMTMNRTEENICRGEIIEDLEYNHFPGLAHVAILCFIASVSIVMMNMLTALAVTDTAKLAKTAKQDMLLSQVELIHYVEKLVSSKFFKYLPLVAQQLFTTKILSIDGEGFHVYTYIRYADVNDKTLPEGLKSVLHEHCKRLEEKEEKEKTKKAKEDKREALEQEVKDLKMMVSSLTAMVSAALDLSPTPSHEARESQAPGGRDGFSADFRLGPHNGGTGSRTGTGRSWQNGHDTIEEDPSC